MKSRSDAAVEVKARTDRDWTRVYAEADGRDVSHLMYFPVPMQVAEQGRVRMAGIGGVGTEREFRRRGLGAKVFAHAVERLRREGYSCIGLYTSQRIVAHRLYRRFGLADIARNRRARKLLDPRSFVHRCFADIIGQEGDLQTRRPVLCVELPTDGPVCLRLEEGGVQVLGAQASHVDLTLAMSSSTLLGLSNRDFDLRYAVAARAVRWRGDAEIYHLLADLMAARRRPMSEE
jgi:GNAT superfamily N-acetyltransferase